MEQHEPVSINAPPHSEACFGFCPGFYLRCEKFTLAKEVHHDRDMNLDSHCYKPCEVSLSYVIPASSSVKRRAYHREDPGLDASCQGSWWKGGGLPI